MSSAALLLGVGVLECFIINQSFSCWEKNNLIFFTEDVKDEEIDY